MTDDMILTLNSKSLSADKLRSFEEFLGDVSTTDLIAVLRRVSAEVNDRMGD